MKLSRSEMAFSGMSRQADLQSQNIVLRQRLDDFMSEARRNEQKLRRFEKLELHLISLDSLYALVKALIYPHTTRIQWDVVTLMLVDPEYEIRRMLVDDGAVLGDHQNLVFADSLSDLDTIYPHSLFPTLSAYRPGKHGVLFPRAKPRPGSVALLPLVRQGKLIGSLNIGSHDEARFVRGVRTDFFEHFAAVVAICIENAVNMQRLKRQGLTDTLTAVNNRRFFDQRLAEVTTMAWRHKEPLSCMLLDVDFFKKVNDTYGHQIGDQVLTEVAGLIRAQLRGSDVLARYGGEEFAALLPKAAINTAEEVAERVRKSIEEHQFTLPDGKSFNVTISIGISAYHPEQSADDKAPEGEALVGQADRGLYAAKDGGRNRVVVAAQ